MQRLARPILAACLAISACAADFGSASALTFALPESGWTYGPVRSFEAGFEIGGVSAEPTRAWWSEGLRADFNGFIGRSISRAFDTELVIARAPGFAPPAYDLRHLEILGAAPIPVPSTATGLHGLTIAADAAPLRYLAPAPASAASSLLPAPASVSESELFAALPRLTLPVNTADADARRLAHFAELHADDFGQLTFDGVAIATSEAHGTAPGGGAHIAIPVLRSRVAVDFAARERQLSDFSGAGDAPLGDPTATNPAFGTQNFVDDAHPAYRAGVSMPVFKDVTVGVGYNTQDYRGSYGTTLGANIAPRKDEYTATMTYTIPKTTSSISALVGNQHYTDYVLPTFNVEQNREQLNFTVRF